MQRTFENWRDIHFGKVSLNQYRITQEGYANARDMLIYFLNTDISQVSILEQLEVPLNGLAYAIQTVIKVNGIHDNENREDTSYGIVQDDSRYSVFIPFSDYTLIANVDNNSVRFYATKFSELPSFSQRREYRQERLYEVILYTKNEDKRPILGYSYAADFHNNEPPYKTESFYLSLDRSASSLKGFAKLMKRGVEDLLHLPSPATVPAVFGT